jgi:hypothetical protein
MLVARHSFVFYELCHIRQVMRFDMSDARLAVRVTYEGLLEIFFTGVPHLHLVLILKCLPHWPQQMIQAGCARCLQLSG